MRTGRPPPPRLGSPPRSPAHLPSAESATSTTERQQPQPGTSPHQPGFSRSRDTPTGDIWLFRLAALSDQADAAAISSGSYPILRVPPLTMRGEVAQCHQTMWSSSVAGPGPRGGCGRSPPLPWWRCWPVWWSSVPGRTGPLLPRGRGRRRPPHGRLAARTYQWEGLRSRGLRSRSRADRLLICRRSGWPSNTPVPM